MTFTCCGRPVRDISIDLTSDSLAFAYCGRCERSQWFRDGEPVALDAVKQLAAARWNRKAAAA